MKSKVLLFSAALIFFTGLQSCKDENRETRDLDNDATEQVRGGQEAKELEDTDVVPSGTYTGTARIVDSEQNEIYLDLEDNRTIELYTSNDTKFMRNGEQVNFDALEQGQRLEVEVERQGESLKPLMIRILQ